MSGNTGLAGSGIGLGQVINGLFGLILAIGGWFLITAWNQIQDLRESQHQFERMMVQDYVRRDDLAEVKAALLRIEDKLDGKADKAR